MSEEANMTGDENKLPPADLSSMFGSPGGRASGLAGLPKGSGGVPKRAPRSPRRPEEVDEVSAEPEKASRPAQQPRKVAEALPVGLEEALSQVTVYVPVQLREQVRTERQRALAEGKVRTNASVVLDAIEEAAPELSDLMLSDLGEPATSGGLFTHRDRSVRPAGAQLPMRISGHDKRVMDQLAEQYCAGNRSRLVEVALRRRFSVEG